MVDNNINWIVMWNGRHVMDTNAPYVPNVGDKLDIHGCPGYFKVTEREWTIRPSGVSIILYTESA